MRQVNAKDVPPARKVAQVKQYLTVIANEFTQYRFHVKTQVSIVFLRYSLTLMRSQIKKSVESDDALVRNIASLAHAVCPKGLVVTLAHYMRMAYLVRVCLPSMAMSDSVIVALVLRQLPRLYGRAVLDQTRQAPCCRPEGRRGSGRRVSAVLSNHGRY
jgi:hypothetical protein